jgi:hypothetical protein
MIIDVIVKAIFSRKDAKKISFNINKLTLRPLRLCSRPEGFYRFIIIIFEYMAKGLESQGPQALALLLDERAIKQYNLSSSPYH